MEDVRVLRKQLSSPFRDSGAGGFATNNQRTKTYIVRQAAGGVRYNAAQLSHQPCH